MSTALFSGVDHVGVGVGDMDEGISFYGRVGFSDVLFDWTGEVPGTDRLLGRTGTELAEAMAWLAWYAPGTFQAVMDYMDTVNGEPLPGRM